MPIRVNYDKALRKMRALGVVLNKPLRYTLESGARVCAISLAKSTQPSRGEGTGNDSYQLGLKAIERDILAVYALPRDAYNDISSQRARAAFWKAYKAGEIDVAERLLQDFGSNLKNTSFEDFDGGAAHLELRRKNRPVIAKKQRPKMIVTDPRPVFRYIDKMKKEVGKAKGAWADVVRATGSDRIRGLRKAGDITASWITGKGHGYGRAFHGGTDTNPTIRIETGIDYMRQVLSQSAESYAKKIAHDRMIEALNKAVEYETKNLRSAA